MRYLLLISWFLFFSIGSQAENLSFGDDVPSPDSGSFGDPNTELSYGDSYSSPDPYSTSGDGLSMGTSVETSSSSTATNSGAYGNDFPGPSDDGDNNASDSSGGSGGGSGDRFMPDPPTNFHYEKEAFDALYEEYINQKAAFEKGEQTLEEMQGNLKDHREAYTGGATAAQATFSQETVLQGDEKKEAVQTSERAFYNEVKDHYDRNGYDAYGDSRVVPNGKAEAVVESLARDRTFYDDTEYTPSDALADKDFVDPNHPANQEMIREIDENFRNGVVDVYAPGETPVGVDINTLDPTQKLGAFTSMTVVGPKGVIADINNHGPQSFENDTSEVGQAVEAVNGRSDVVGGINVQTMSDVLPGGVNLVSTDYVTVAGHPVDPADVYKHEVTHAGDLALEHIASSMDLSGLSPEQIETIENGVEAVKSSWSNSTDEKYVDSEGNPLTSDFSYYAFLGAEVRASLEQDVNTLAASVATFEGEITQAEAVEFYEEARTDNPVSGWGLEDQAIDAASEVVGQEIGISN